MVKVKKQPVSALSRTQKALKLMAEDGYSGYAAANIVGISQVAISRALKRRRETESPTCPCCNQIVRNGFVINKVVLVDTWKKRSKAAEQVLKIRKGMTGK